MMQQIFKMWSYFVCPLGPFLLAQSQIWLVVSTACFPCNQADRWQQLNYHTLLTTYSLLSRHEKLEKLEMILKIYNLKKWEKEGKQAKVSISYDRIIKCV